MLIALCFIYIRRSLVNFTLSHDIGRAKRHYFDASKAERGTFFRSRPFSLFACEMSTEERRAG
jgi:hypothetical protein